MKLRKSTTQNAERERRSEGERENKRKPMESEETEEIKETMAYGGSA